MTDRPGQRRPWQIGESVLGQLRDAIQRGWAQGVEELLPSVDQINARDMGGVTLLNYAAGESNIQIVQMLLRRGADVNAADDRGFTPLHLAAAHESHEVTRTLIKRGANVNARSLYRGLSPLHEVHDPEMVRILLAAGAAIEAQDDDGNTPLHWAMWGDRPEVAEELLRNGSNPWRTNNEGLTPRDERPEDWWDWFLKEIIPPAGE